MSLSSRAQVLVNEFTAGLNAEQRTNFNDTLRDSPVLVDRINNAVGWGYLRGFSLLPPGDHTGGGFDPQSQRLLLPVSIMSAPSGGRRFNPSELTFVLGHEVEHANKWTTQNQVSNNFETEVGRIARSTGAVHDYTAALNTRLAAHRESEANANVAGYNATVSMLRTTNGGRNPTYEELYRANPGRMDDVIAVTPGHPTRYALRDGYTLNADMTMTPERANARGVTNIEAMARNYYDAPASMARLGANGDSNYQNDYAARHVGLIAQRELANAPGHATNGIHPRVQLNMNALGISERQLERNGLDLGGTRLRQPYYDTGVNPPRQGYFDHTSATHRYMPITMSEAHSQHAPQGPSRNPAVQQAMEALDRSPNIPADAFGASRLNVATAIALHAASQNLRPDHIVFNSSQNALIAVQGELSSPTSALSTPLPVAQAIATDVGAAQRQLENPQPSQAPQQGLAQVARDQAPQQDPLALDSKAH